ncbi:MAG TPA: asparagine synthase (glutamine-hydrolyzing) [Gammaproteobacteria bacterium]|nr:asparagine synthase (glutamine-hydrolyzing) [Gammaproteobacteria bacterium]
MCGLTGFWQAGGCAAERATATLDSMATAIAHRGPDDRGLWFDTDAGIGLAHRRLSILDLSPAGHQPMSSASGRYVLVFNGEIYNHLDLRRELERNHPHPGPPPSRGRESSLEGEGSLGWRGHSDTETLLAGFEVWGIAATLQRTIGMFAIAVWDRAERSLTLARDRLGEKPLYYGGQGDCFLFGSELKALRAHPAFNAAIDRDALSLFLRHNYIPTPHTIYQGIHKLPPGTLLTLSSAQRHTDHAPTPYWSLRDAVERGQAQPFQGTDAEAITALDDLLRDAVQRQQLADVPLGAFLSGGVDSSTIVALMQAQSSRPVKTFTIGFHETGYNEAHYAKAVARHLGTDHTELYVTPEQAQAVIPRLPTLYDEPFADSSQIPTFLVSELTRQQVTVSLSGDAGDELFGGYNRYLLAGSIWRKIRRLSPPLRTLVARSITALPPAAWDRGCGALARVLPLRWRFSLPGDKVHKLADILTAASPELIYRGLVSHWPQPATVVIGATEPTTVLNQAAAWPNLDFEQRMLYLDTLSYLPDDILVKVDRAAMAVSLETRVPLLDHRVVEFAWRLPLAMKIRHGESKWILRQVLDRYVPRTLIERPKMGFGVPLDCWLRGPLREWAEDLLDENRLRQEGFFNPEPIRRKWAEHLTGTRNWQYHLWDVLMFQAWWESTR